MSKAELGAHVLGTPPDVSVSIVASPWADICHVQVALGTLWWCPTQTSSLLKELDGCVVIAGRETQEVQTHGKGDQANREVPIENSS